MSEIEPALGKTVETFNPKDYPELTHCTIIERSIDVSWTISIMDINGKVSTLVVPHEAIRLTNVPSIALLLCKLIKPIDNNKTNTPIVVPTTSGESEINILTKYIARRR